ncbi:hypothetical protein OAX11_03590 [Flavobacteriaceae bacterium]|nr:hypothetical protein [Flavobacteriaceae bacterium]
MRFLLYFAVLLFFSCKIATNQTHKKKTQTTIHKEEFSVFLKKINPSLKKTYFWYLSNEVHQSKGDYGGELLHGNYTKYYVTNQLAEKGYFSKGLKQGEWVTWFVNGHIETISSWNNGVLSGNQEYYDDTGEIVLKGKYNNGLKTGVWIDYTDKNKVRYKKGVVILQKRDTVFKNNQKDTIKNNSSKKKEKDSIKNIKESSFLNRLFSKKT